MSAKTHDVVIAGYATIDAAKEDNTDAVFLRTKYNCTEEWLDQNEFTQEQDYHVGGNTKLYGAALFRLRPQDFGVIQHHGGPSPAWPLSYQDFEPFYAEAERLYYVHSAAGEDPTDGPHHPRQGRHRPSRPPQRTTTPRGSPACARSSTPCSLTSASTTGHTSAASTCTKA